MTRAGRRSVGAVTGLACALVVLGPALGRGFLLRYDLVFVPRLGLGYRTLGIDGSVPRAVPGDLIVSLASTVMPGQLVQKLLLVAVFVGVGAGVALLVPSRRAAAAAALVACWNPFVAERMDIGHWGFLLGYAAIPWVAAAAGGLRDGRPGSRARVAAALTGAAATGATGALYGALVAVAVLATGRSRRAIAFALGVAVLANAPWWWPYLTLAPGGTADPRGVTAFAARADTPLGVLGSLLTGGGIWNQATRFGERSTWLVAIVATAAVIALVAWWTVRGRWRREPVLTGLALAGAAGLLVALFPTVAPAGARWFVGHVPGGGLIRDSQKFAAPWMIWVAAATGHAVHRLPPALRARGAPRAVATGLAAACALWSVVTLPTLAWGALGQWRTAQYPASYTRTAARIDALPVGGVAVFPWTQYRRYAWNHDVVVLDPWQRLVSRDVVVNDDLPLRDGAAVAGESRAARAIGEAIGTRRLAAVMRSRGIRWVLIETDQPGQDVRAGDLPGARPVSRSSGLLLLDLGAHGLRLPAAPAWWAWTGLAAGMVAVLGSAAGMLRLGANARYTASKGRSMRGTPR